MQRALAVERSPALAAVLRYFLCTPLFALLAGLLLAWQGEAALVTRWSPVTLALTHLFTLGALGMTMAGALIQILPVVAGSELPAERTMSGAVHALLAVGCVALAAGFLAGEPLLFRVALPALTAGLLWLVVALSVGLWATRPPGAEEMTSVVRLALAALVVTVVLGAALAAAFAWPAQPALVPLLTATDLHALWGLFGWSGLLLAGVSVQVVPMFQVTPLYQPQHVGRFGSVVFVLLVAASVSTALPPPATMVVSGILMLCFALFALVTLVLLSRRTRPEPDAMTLFWRLAMGCLVAGPLLWAVPPELAGSGQTIALGVLAIVGFLFSTVCGMLYKIVPFLVWQDRQLTQPGKRGPSVKNLLPDRHAQRQFWLHAASLALLLSACWWPGQLARAAGLLMCASAAMLAWNLSRPLAAR